MRRSRPTSARGALWTAAYATCLVVVLSFIVFEVLDVDGSDFTPPLRTGCVTAVAEPAENLRRTPLPVAAAAFVAVPTVGYAERSRVQPGLVDRRWQTPYRPSLDRGARTALARALLPDPVPAA